MLCAPLFSLVASVLVPALALQVPLVSSHHWKGDHVAINGDNDPTDWSFDEFPNPNVTDHLVFETVYSLLQHWPNTRMRNGHNIVPGIIPKGTLLYHGTHLKKLPPGPEWVATDPEFSYFFCRDFWGSNPLREGCWLLTLATTRPLNIVYFDGSSAAKFPHGSLDAQDLIAWGESRPDDALEELRRIEDLCGWAKNYGLDGIVRMSLGFEIMLCDFTSGVSVVSFANLERPEGVFPSTTGFVTFEAVNAGSRHNHFPGETRVQLNLAELVSFYDTQLVPSLVAVRASQDRWDHRLQNISSADLSAVKSKLEAVFTRPSGLSSGIDWKTLLHVIVDRFAGRLELTRHLLDTPATNPDEILDLANKTHTQLRIMLTPYILFSATPTDPSDKTDLDWMKPIHKLCATTHTYSMESEIDSMTDSERLILQAVRGTSREICRVVTKMWAAGVYAGIDQSLNTKESLDIEEVTQVWSSWAEDLNQLMAWLDWSVWVKCNPSCGPEEMCYLPTWPVAFPGVSVTAPTPGRLSGPSRQRKRLTNFGLRTMAMENFTQEILNTVAPEADEWVRPQPKCIKRVDPYGF